MRVSHSREEVRLAALLLGALALSACTFAPYDPGRATLPAILPDDAFRRVEDVVRLQYPELVIADAEKFALQSDWCAREDRGAAAQCRLTLWREADQLCAVVEVRWLRGTLAGPPEWTGVRGHKLWERDILDRAVAALEASG